MLFSQTLQHKKYGNVFALGDCAGGSACTVASLILAVEELKEAVLLGNCEGAPAACVATLMLLLCDYSVLSGS